MSGPDSEGPAGEAPASREAAEPRDELSYQGTRVPGFLVILWIGFLLWGAAYLVRYLPESWMEWFGRE